MIKQYVMIGIAIPLLRVAYGGSDAGADNFHAFSTRAGCCRDMD